MEAVAYTDCSYSDKYKIASVGFIATLKGQVVKHEIKFLAGVNSTRDAELYAVNEALQFLFLIDGVKNIQINTDFAQIAYMKISSKNPLFVEMKEILSIIKEHKIGVTINHVWGHSGNFYNEKIDKSCRKQLRKFINNIHSGKI